MCIVWCLRPRLCCQSRSSSTVLRSSSSAVSALNGIFDSICAEVLICGDSIKMCVCVLAVGEHGEHNCKTFYCGSICFVCSLQLHLCCLSSAEFTCASCWGAWCCKTFDCCHICIVCSLRPHLCFLLQLIDWVCILVYTLSRLLQFRVCVL